MLLAAAVVLGIVAVLAVLAVPFALLGIGVSPFGDLSFERKHLDEIPISADACPYVRQIHKAANELQLAMPFGGWAVDRRGAPLTWADTRARLGPAGDKLEYLLVGSAPYFPEPVQEQFDVVVGAIREARPHLAQKSVYTWDFEKATERAFRRGQRAFGFAGDLVGDQCGVKLEADESTTVWAREIGASTTTSSANEKQ